jgi:hypothetical protein
MHAKVSQRSVVRRAYGDSTEIVGWSSSGEYAPNLSQIQARLGPVRRLTPVTSAHTIRECLLNPGGNDPTDTIRCGDWESPLWYFGHGVFAAVKRL